MAIKELLRIVVDADVDGAVKSVNKFGAVADKDLGKAETRIDKVGAGFRKAGAVMLGAGAVAAAGILKSVDATATLEQAVGGTEAVFGDARDAIDRYAEGSAQAMGLSEREFREATTSIGGQLKRMTGDVDFAAEQSVELTRVAADLAATYGGTTAEAVQALGSAFRGEADPAERFNLNLKVGAVNAKAVELGLAATTSKVDENARAQATLALITEQSADAQGQFARESDTVAGSQQRAAAEFENAQAALGEALAPAMASAAGFAADLTGKFSALNESTGGLASQAALGVTGFLLVGGAISTLIGQAIKMRDTWVSMKATMAATNWASMAAGAASVAAAFVAVGVAVKTYSDEMGNASSEAEAMAQRHIGAFDVTSASAEELADQYARLVDAYYAHHEAGNNAVNPLLAERHYETADAIAEELHSYDALVATATELVEVEGMTADEALKVATNTDIMAAATNEATGEFDAAAAATEDAVAALEEMENALKAQFDPLFGMQDALINLKEKQWLAAEAAREHGAGSDEAREANREATRAAVDYQASLLTLKGAVEAGDTSIESATGTLRAWVDQGILTEEQAQQATDELGWLALAADNVDGKDVVVTAYADIGPANSELDRLARRINSMNAGPRISEGGGGGFNLLSGGPVPGPADQPVSGTLHGGEYVLSRPVVEAIKRGDPNRQIDPGGSSPTPNQTTVGGAKVEINLNGGDYDMNALARVVAWSLA